MAPSEKWSVRTPDPDLVFLLERDQSIEIDLLGGRLAIGFDHDRKLDQAGGGHRDVGVVTERLAGAKMLDGDRDLALVGRDQGLSRDSESRRDDFVGWLACCCVAR